MEFVLVRRGFSSEGGAWSAAPRGRAGLVHTDPGERRLSFDFCSDVGVGTRESGLVRG